MGAVALPICVVSSATTTSGLWAWYSLVETTTAGRRLLSTAPESAKVTTSPGSKGMIFAFAETCGGP